MWILHSCARDVCDLSVGDAIDARAAVGEEIVLSRAALPGLVRRLVEQVRGKEGQFIGRTVVACVIESTRFEGVEVPD